MRPNPRWRIHQADVGGWSLASAEAGSPDAEMGPLQKQGDSLDDTRTDLALQSARNTCAWLAIGWLFMVKHAPFQISELSSSTAGISTDDIPSPHINVLLQVYTILCRTTFQSFACMDIDEGESFNQNE